MSRKDLHQRVSRWKGRRPVWLAALVVALALATVGLASAGVKHANHGSAPTKGGTLVMLGASDIFNLDTTSGYYTVTSMIERAFTRQLVSYPNAPSFLVGSLRHPAAGRRTTALIRWQGIRLWLKHLPVMPRPVAPAQERVTVP